MTAGNGRNVENLQQEFVSGRLSRRQFLGRLLALGVSLPAASALIAACTGPTSTSSSSSSPTSAPKSGGTLKYALLRDPIHFDPNVSSGFTSMSLTAVVYDSLIEYDTQGNYVGALAETWEHPDPLTWVFHLRKGVQFHNGKSFDANDVVATFNRVKDPKTGSQRAGMVNNFAKIETPDSMTVRVSLANPNPTLLDSLVGDGNATLLIASADDIKAGMDFKTKTNGTGAFKLTSWEPAGKYVLTKNPNYWKKGLPYLDGIVQQTIADDKTRANALRSGEVDFIEVVPWQETTAFASQPAYKVYEYSSSFNMIRLRKDIAPLNDKRVRQALNFIADRQEIVQLAFGGHGRAIDGPLQQPDNPYYSKDLEGYYKKDWTKAGSLLALAGYSTPADVPPLELAATPAAALNDPAQVLLQQMLKFGLRVTFKAIDNPTLLADRSNPRLSMVSDGRGFSTPDPDNLSQYFLSTGTEPNLANSKVDQLLAQGASTTDAAQRKTIYRQAEELILDEAPWIFMDWRNTAEVIPTYVKGYQVMPRGLGSQNTRRTPQIWLDK